MDHDTGHHLPSEYITPTTDHNTPATLSEDVEMTPDSAHSEETDSVQALMEFSDASDSSESGSVQSAADAHEIMMQADGSEHDSTPPGPSYESSSGPTLNSTVLQSRPASQRSNNRRARVEDDEDEERDRRHPSQRISNPSPDSSVNSRTSSSAPSPPQSQPPTRPQTARIRTTFTIPSLTRLGIDQTGPFRFFQHLMPQSQPPQNNTQNSMNDTPTPSNANATAPQEPPQPPQVNGAPNSQPTQAQPHGGFTLIFLQSGLGFLPPLRIIPHLGNAHTTLSGNEQSDFQMFTEMLLRLGMLGAAFGGFSGEPEVEDPERARKLINGLEEVPLGLVRRLERIGGTDDEDGGRDTMCAICWDQLLDDAGFKDNDSKESTSDGTNISDPAEPSLRESTPSPDSASQDAAAKHPKIVSLPCAHIFHADCLIPWFSRPRQTTCPTCRFNIDPENLTRSRRRRSSPRMPTGPSPDVPAPDNQTEQQPTTTATGDANNTVPTATGQDNESPNRPSGQFIFDQLRIPIVVSGQTLFPSGLGARNASDGGPSRDVLDQLRASMEERLRGRAGQGPPNGGNAGSNNTNDSSLADDPTASQTSVPPTTHINPPTQPATPTSLPPPSHPNTQTGSEDDHGVTHSIVFGFDVLVGGAIMGPRPEGNTMDVDDGVGNDGDNRDWMGMTLRDIFGGRGEPRTEVPDDNNAQQNGGTNFRNQENDDSGMEAGQNRTTTEGLPQFLNMNLGNGESLHIASGSGRTMGEAMAQLFGGMGPTPFGTNGDGRQTQNVAPGAGANTNTATPENDNAPQNESNDRDNQGPTNGGMFAGMGMMPFQFMAQMLGFATPGRVRRRNGQNQNQASETADTPSSAPASEAPEARQAENTTANANSAQGSEQGAAPQTTTGGNTNDDSPFTRFMRNLAGNLPPGAAGPQEENVHMHFLPGGFTIPGFPLRGDAPGPMPTNMRQSEKKQWAPPPAPGPTLRQRIEKREREAGLRCYDVSCGVGPSDEDPLISGTADEMKQLTLRPVNMEGSTCRHTFHRSCLVSTERVALRGADAPVVGDDVEVSCSVCRAVGRVSKNDWEEGVQQLS